MNLPICLATVILLLIGFIVRFIVKKIEIPKGRVIHKRIVLDFQTEQGEDIAIIYKCQNCGLEQHGVPPCEMCGYDSMKKVNN